MELKHFGDLEGSTIFGKDTITYANSTTTSGALVPGRDWAILNDGGKTGLWHVNLNYGLAITRWFHAVRLSTPGRRSEQVTGSTVLSTPPFIAKAIKTPKH